MPWTGWPERPDGLEKKDYEDGLRRESIPARLLRLVHSNSTFKESLHLPCMEMDVTDGFFFGWTHRKMKGRDVALPISVVKSLFEPCC